MDLPPPGPPPSSRPPSVPDGWRPVWDGRYNSWFFINVYTNQSQWDHPTVPARPVGSGSPNPPPGPPPMPSRTGLSGYPSGGNDTVGDEALARRLQEEEQARMRQNGSRNGNDRGDYYSRPQDQAYPPPAYGNAPYGGRPGQQYQPNNGQGAAGYGSQPGQMYQQGYQQQQQQQQQQQAYPPQGYPADYSQSPDPSKRAAGGGAAGVLSSIFHKQKPSTSPQPGYYSPQPQMVPTAAPPKKSRFGGAAGLALGAGAGILGTALISHEVHEYHERVEDAYEEGYEEGREEQQYDDSDMGFDF